MKKILLTCILALVTLATYAQTITGTWYGTLKIGENPLHVVFHVTKSGNDYVTTMDSPDQGAMGIATDKTQFLNNELTIEAAKFGMKYTGTFKADSNKINGIFKQGPASLPLVLTPNKPADSKKASVKRPQDPTSFPYKQEDITFNNVKAGNILAGTLTIPTGKKPEKVVILISGSGPQDRNEEVAQFNHRPFLVWSDWLTKQGIAVLRYDDRGVGKSTGKFGTATSAEFADDAEAAVNYLQSRPEFKGISIGLMGHSEGGMIAPMVAARNNKVKFVVLLAAPGVPINELMVQQSTDQMRLSGAPENIITQSVSTNSKLFKAMRQFNNLPEAAFKAKMDTVIYQQLRATPKEALGGQSIDDVAKRTTSQIYTPWFRYFIAYNPAANIEKLRCPVLALNGTLDMQVQEKANLAGIKAALIKGGNKHFEVVTLPKLNHLFQLASTGSGSEYAKIDETVNPSALVKVSNWITQLK
ncbi:alpha/beta hydrolase family protein [Mucilaginibacter aquatilis]|uniref:Alpha/beta fold hydrolase n=1 Tax=Mucilaginibacter aquatilis TaxID=1517760 RepID=A0A6I4II98_9SPHI|nr:alpha/beta hydrolase [Mucilaginibacter aquatilis]MVN93019.1 alpha/beta fold hydrolase [Mucilaginibacter aquatilis]